MKKFLSIVLCLCMIISCLPALSFAEDAPSGGIDGLEQYKKCSTTINDGYIGIPVDIYTYYNEEFNPDENTTVIFYVINTNTERIGTESDYNILNDLINNKGYVCMVVDYRNAPGAVSPALDHSMLKIQARVAEFKNGLGHVIANENNYTVPAGYSITLGEYYWSFDKHGTDGCLEQIVDVWNSDFKSVKANQTITYKNGTTAKVGDTTANSIYDCVKADGSPVDLDLRMDIIYPVKAKRKVPVMLHASSWETRSGGIIHNETAYGFLFSGYALAVYDYAYVPMARDDHYGYFDGDGMGSVGGVTGDNKSFSLGMYTSMKSDTAAVRKLRYLADTQPEKYAFDVNKFGVWGASKQGNCFKLGEQHPENLAEFRTFVGHHGETRYENGKIAGDGNGENGSDIIRGGEPQPWLTYKDGTPIPSNVQFAYGAVGGDPYDISDGHCPMFATGSMLDGTYSYIYPALVAALRNHNIASVNLSFANLAHEYVKDTEDAIYGINGYDAFYSLANYYLKDCGAKVIYIDYHADKTSLDSKAKITFKFSGEVDESEVRKIVIKNKLNGEIAKGSYSSEFGDTEWTFEPHNLKGGCEYSVYVPDSIICKNGKNLKESKRDSFKVKPEVLKSASILSSDNEMTLLKTDSSNDSVYFAFDKTDFSDQTSVYLRFSVANDAANTVMVYKIAELDETNIKNSAAGELLSEIVLTGKGDYEIDVTDYVKNLNGEKPGFILKAKNNKETKTIASYDFENLNDDDTSVSGLTLSKYADICVSSEKAAADGSDNKSLKIAYMKDNNYKNRKYHYWIDRVNDTIQINNIIKKTALNQTDKGRKFKISFNVFDSRERGIAYFLTPYTSYTDFGRIDFRANKYTDKTEKGAWKNYSFDYKIDEDVETTINKQNLSLYLYSAAEEENTPAYIDDILVTEDISEVNIADKTSESAFAPSLVLHPSSDNVLYASKTEYADSSNADTPASDSVFVSGRANTVNSSGLYKTYVNLDLSNFQTGRAYFGFETSESSKGNISVYALNPENSFRSGTINYYNAPANDIFGYSVKEENSFLKAPIKEFDINGKNSYTLDVTGAANAAKKAGKDNLTLVFVCKTNSSEVIAKEDFNDISVSTGMYGGGGLSEYGRNAVNNRTGVEGYAYYVEAVSYAWERLKVNILDYTKLTEKDIGRSFKFTYYVKTDVPAKYQNALTHRSGDVKKQTKMQTITEANKWQKMTYSFTLTADEISDVSNPAKGICSLINFENLPIGQTIYIDDMTLEETGLGKAEITPLENINPPKVVSQINFDDWTVGTVKRNNYQTEVNDYMGVAGNGFDNNTQISISEADDVTGGGKSFLFTPNQAWNRLKFYNIFDHNLTSEDVGRKVNISFRVKSSAAGSFSYGMMSSVYRDNSGSFKLSEGYETDDKDYSEKFYKTSYTGRIAGADINKWKTFSFDVTVDENMLAKRGAFSDSPDTKYDIAIALLGFVPSSSLVGKDIYIDDICVTEEGKTEQTLVTVKKTVAQTNFDDWTTGTVKRNHYYTEVNDYKVVDGNGFDNNTKISISEADDATTGGGKSFLFVPNAAHNRLKFYNIFDHNLTSEDIGRKVNVSFKVKSNTAGKFYYGMMSSVYRDNSGSFKLVSGYEADDKDYSEKFYKTSYGGIIAVEDVDTWKTFSFDVTVDENMLAKRGAYTDNPDVTYDIAIALMGFVPASSLVGANIYIDDIIVTEEKEELVCVNGALPVKDYASVSYSTVNTASMITSGNNSDEKAKHIRKAYAKFDAGEYDNTLKATLNFNVENENGKTLNLWMIKDNEYPENLTYENAPASEADENMTLTEIYGAAPVQIDLSGAKTYSVDVTDYIRKNSGKDYIFAFTSGETGGSECVFNYDASRFTKDLDYALFGENSSASAENGKVKTNGTAAFLNVFGQNETAEIGRKYLVSADVTSANGGEVTIAAADKNGEIKESSSYNLTAGNAQSVKLEFTALTDDIANIMLTGENLTAENISVLKDCGIQIGKDVSIDIKSAKNPEIEDNRKLYEISVSSTDGSVSIDDEDCGASYVGSYESGEIIKLKANGEGKFLYWIDLSDRRVVSYDESFSFTVGTDRKLAAVYAANDTAYVTFTSFETTVLAAGEAQSRSLYVPQNPYVYGYEFTGWYKDGKLSEYKAGDLVTDAQSASYKAGFGKKDTKYTITVNGNESTYSYNDKVEVAADAEKNGKTFSYWEKDGNISSYNSEYSFFASSDSTLNAVYGESAENKNVLVMANPVMADETRIAFFAERNISSDCEIIETGILMGKTKNLSVDSADIKAVAKSKAKKGQFTVRKKGVNPDDTWYGRAYVIYRDSTGAIQKIYSNEVSMTVK